ncbi:hypothetical protein PR048_030383 [Dryococelus australis]|uniref:Secreted protein n=1 Tax=Dryococelus australis TaxID=614101 RepID=A0ABQ9GBJ7_9NEOP|nr:hypothetical protein PR048_030383 [Dryococelus australis]
MTVVVMTLLPCVADGPAAARAAEGARVLALLLQRRHVFQEEVTSHLPCIPPEIGPRSLAPVATATDDRALFRCPWVYTQSVSPPSAFTFHAVLYCVVCVMLLPVV